MEQFFHPKSNFVNQPPESSHTSENIGIESQQPINTGAKTNLDNSQFKGNFDGLLEHFSQNVQEVRENPNQRRKPAQDESNLDDDLPNDNLDDDTEIDEETGEPKPKQSTEFYEQQGKFIADMTDIVVPKGIAFLNGQKGKNEKGIPFENEYKAESQLKKEIGLAWARVLEEKAVSLTPTQQLIWVNVMAYGLPLSLSVWSFIQRTMQKREEQNLAMMQTLENLNNNIRGTENPPPNPTPNPPPKPPQNEPPLTVVEVDNFEQEEEVLNPEISKPFFENNNGEIDSHFKLDETQEIEERGEEIVIGREMKVCSHSDCQKSYEVGTGFGKTRNSKNLDKFCSHKCLRNYVNTQNVLQRKNIKK